MQTFANAEEASRSERAALAWLADQAEVAAAVELAEGGDEEKAIKKLAEAVRELLFPGQQPRIDPLDPELPEPATKLRRVDVASPAEEPISEEVGKAMNRARCVCIVFSGMRGTGKTTLCSILQKVIGGEHIHFDEITSQPNDKKAFQRCLKKALTNSLAATKGEKQSKGLSGTSPQEVASEPEDPLAPKKLSKGAKVIYVDRTQLLSTQRAETIAVLQKLRWKHRECRTMLVDFSHSSDGFGYGTDGQLSKRFGKNHIELCAQRIEGRRAHPVLLPSSKLKSSLQKEAKAAEPPSPQELRHFDACLTLEVANSPVEQVLAVVQELKRLGWLSIASDADVLSLQVELAWQVYSHRQDSQSTLCAQPDGAGAEEKREWLAQCKRAAAEKAAQAATELKRQAKAACWKFEIPEVRQTLLQRNILPPCFQIEPEIVVELLKIPDGDLDLAAKEQGLEVDALEAMKEALEALQGETFEVRMTRILISETTACALVSLPPVVPHLGKVPHVVLGVRRGASKQPIEKLQEEAAKVGQSSVTSVDLPDPKPMAGRLILAS